jgi:glutathione synthase/RimK-type ligase-like ATP-grasp enzyme
MHYQEKDNLDIAQTILLDPNIRAGNNDIYVGLVKDTGELPYYTKFERFLKNNKIAYDYFYIHSSSWNKDAAKFNVIIWRPMSSPWSLEEAREKIYVLEKYLNKRVYPSYAEVMFYENKILQYYILKNEGFPVIETFISYDYDEVLYWIEKAEYPFVSKLKEGSASQGVSLIRNKRTARGHVEKIFRGGKSTYWPFLKQKNYVFFQKYVENEGFDLRVIIVDENHIFGYYREIPRGEFRASGMGLLVKKELPKEAVKIALDITKQLRFTNLSVDFLRSKADGRFYVIEGSNFIRIKTDEQLKVNGTSGKYRYIYETDSLIFEKGIFWLQELILKRFFEKYYQVYVDHLDGTLTPPHLPLR